MSQSVLGEREGPGTQCPGTSWASRADCSTVHQIPLSCLKLKAAVRVQNLQGLMLTMFKLFPDLAWCCSREQANNQAPAAYREASQGLPAAPWGCKRDFGWPCTDRKEFAFCIHLLTLSSPQQWGRSLKLDRVKQIPTTYTILLSCGLGMDKHSSMKIIDTA